MPSNAVQQLPSNGLRLLDLFCGAGIGAVGFQRAGYDIVDAVDNQKHAVDTYRRNLGEHVRRADISQLRPTEYAQADVIAAGFPCTDFSVAGKGAGTSGKVGMLGNYFVDVVLYQQPRAFVLENVGGLVSKTHKPFFDSLIAALSVNYVVTHELLNFWEFGVPQVRKRIIAVGVRRDLGTSFNFPTRLPLAERPTIRTAIGDLPEPNGENNHSGHGLRPDERPYAHLVPIGGNWRSLPVAGQMAFMKGAFASGGGRTGYLRKVSMDNPAHTLTSSPMGKFNAQLLDLQDKYPGSDLVGSRRFTVRECLRLQTVPDWFSFDEALPLGKQYDRVSGIPSLVAYDFSRRLAGLL